MNVWEMLLGLFITLSVVAARASGKPVTLEEWCAAEAEAGFRPKPGCGPAATAGFSTSVHGGIEGRIECQ